VCSVVFFMGVWGVTFDLIHSGAEWVNARTFARERDEVGNYSYRQARGLSVQINVYCFGLIKSGRLLQRIDV
jgi:hypothetical protein